MAEIQTQQEREAMMQHLRQGDLPEDVQHDVAQAVQDYDAKIAQRGVDAAKAETTTHAGGVPVVSPELGKGIADTTSDLAKEVPLRAAEDAGQLGLNTWRFVTMGKSLRPKILGGATDINPGSDEHLAQFNSGVDARRKQWSDDMRAKYGDTPMSTAADVGAAFMSAPLFLNRAGAVLRTGNEFKASHTFAQDVARNSLVAADQFDPDAVSLLDKGGAMSVGALFPVVARTAGFAWDAAKSLATLGSTAGTGTVAKGLRNNLVRTIDRSSDPESLRAKDQAAQFFNISQVAPEADIPLTLGQVTGHPRIISYENRFSGAVSRDEAKKVRNDIFTAANTYRDILGGKYGTDVFQIRDDVFKGIANTDAGMRLQRATDWAQGMDRVRTTATAMKAATGQPVVFPIDNTVAAYADEINRLANPARMADPAVKSRVEQFGGQLLDAYKSGKGMSVEALMDTLEGLNRGKKFGAVAARGAPGGVDAQVEDIRNRLLDAVYKDAAAGGASAKPVADELLATRETYRVQSDKLRRLQADTLNNLFGDARAMADPETAINTFLSKPPSAQKYGIKLLEEQAPDVLAGMRAHWVQRAIDAGTEKTQAAMKGQFDLQAFDNALFGNKAVQSNLMTPEMVKWANAAKGYISGIYNNTPTAIRPGTNIWPEDIAINVISRSPEFMARAVVRIMTGLNAEKLFVTKEGVNALRTVANLRSVPKESATAAALYLGSLMEDDAQRQAKAQARLQQTQDQYQGMTHQ